MGAVSSQLKIALHALDRAMEDIGKEVNTEEIASIVKQQAIATSVSGGASGMLPGAGPLVAMGVAAGSILTMYVRLSKALGITFKEGTLRALASGVIADISSTILVNLALSAAISFIPGLGQLGSGVICALAYYMLAYTAAYIFIKMLTTMFESKKDISNITAEAITKMAKDTISETDLNKVAKEAKQQYKEDKKE